MTPEEIEALNDDQLRETLKAHPNIKWGPIGDTTRQLYKKKLKDFYKQVNKSASIRHPAAYINQNGTGRPSTSKAKENNPPPVIDNISPIRIITKQVVETQTEEVFVDNVRSPVHESRASANCDVKKAHSTPKIYPDLSPQQGYHKSYDNYCPRPSAKPLQVPREVPVYNYCQQPQPEKTRPRLEFKLLNPNLINNNRSTPFLRTSPAVDSGSRFFQENNNFNNQYGYSDNYGYEHYEQIQYNRPLINLAGSLQSNQRSIYDEPAPPQPIIKNPIQPVNDTMRKQLILFFVVVFFVSLFFWWIGGPIHTENPIKI